MCVYTHTVSYWGIVINATGTSFPNDSDDHTPFHLFPWHSCLTQDDIGKSPVMGPLKNMGHLEMACHHVSLKLQVWGNHQLAMKTSINNYQPLLITLLYNHSKPQLSDSQYTPFSDTQEKTLMSYINPSCLVMIESPSSENHH